MGEVYSAVQESLQRPVALKVVSSRFEADRDFVDRFVAEARAAAALSHPNVVTVHDVGEEAGQHYISMEYMEGGNLEERVTLLGPLPIREAIGVLADATKGLVFAELRGIVHRDIKPANLMQDAFGNTKIADLGLATQINAEVQDEGDRKIFGTPHFISPEQARGERVDCRSDLYSLGATVYRLLSGRTPFEGQTTREILRGHFQERPRPLAELVPGLPPALSLLVARLLEKDPGQRYPSASALLLEVEQLRSTPLDAAAAGQPATGGARRGTWVAVAAASSSRSTVRPWWKRCSRANCSAMCAAPLPARQTTKRDCSRSLAVARCFWTRSVSFRWPSRPSCFGCWSAEKCSGSVRSKRARWMST